MGMFFRKKAKEAGTEAEATLDAGVDAAVEGTMPEVAEADLSVDAAAAPKLDADLAAAAGVPAKASDAIRLFPGFEREDFEVGFSTGPVPSLVMRWKDGGDWFRMPAMFNRAVLTSMDERDSAGDLSRLLRSFGYDVEPA